MNQLISWSIDSQLLSPCWQMTCSILFRQNQTKAKEPIWTPSTHLGQSDLLAQLQIYFRSAECFFLFGDDCQLTYNTIFFWGKIFRSQTFWKMFEVIIVCKFLTLWIFKRKSSNFNLFHNKLFFETYSHIISS